MLSKNKQKLIRSLDRKKNRDAEGLFLAEGPKLVTELLAHFRCRLLVGEPAVLSKVPSEANAVAERVEVTAEESIPNKQRQYLVSERIRRLHRT